MSRLWTNPPATPDGRLDYSALTLAEVREDLTETVSDLVFNGGWSALREPLDALERRALVASLKRIKTAPPESLVKVMNALLDHECTGRLTAEYREDIEEAVRQLQALARAGR